MNESIDCVKCKSNFAVYCGKCAREHVFEVEREFEVLFKKRKGQMEDVIRDLDEQYKNVQFLVVQVESLRELLNRAELNLQMATEALGESWLHGGLSLAEGIRRKVASLEEVDG